MNFTFGMTGEELAEYFNDAYKKICADIARDILGDNEYLKDSIPYQNCTNTNNDKPFRITSGNSIVQLQNCVITKSGAIQKRHGLENILKPLGCDHEWKTYQGFTENYDFCVHCDVKK